MDKVDFRAVSGKDFSRIIVAVIDGETWISGTDAAKATGHVWTDFAVDRFVKDSDKRTADIPDSQIVVSRNGLHSLVAESRKPYAEKVEKAIIEAVYSQEEPKTAEAVSSNGITIFNNAEFGEMRTIEDNGQILFCGSDVAKALGYKDTVNALKSHCRWVVKHHIPHPQSPSKVIEMSFIPEGDVIRLAAHSKLKGAERFESWIFDEVMPTVIKTGTYSIPTAENRELEIRKQELNIRKAELIFKMLSADIISDDYKNILIAKAVETLTGKMIISTDNTEEYSNIANMDMTEYGAEEKLYSATEIGNMFGLSRQKIIYLAKQNNIRDNEEYGKFQLFYNVNIFCYNEKAIARFREILGGNQLVIDVIA
ncbi:MAG: hypothetical protein NC489_15900 [Ruminococcus flavefaciens]|nr:hypothetical protein [Ruminococcus flavefaciens]